MSKRRSQRLSLNKRKRKGSLDCKDLDEVQRLWISEAIARRDEIRSRAVKPIPGPEVLRDARRLVGRS
jgi:hypothetical protein